MTTETLRINELKLNDDNPRTITTEKFEKLVDSLLCFPKMLGLRPIVVDHDYMVIGGNMRTKALMYIAGLSYDQIVERLNGNEIFLKKHQSEGEEIFSYWKKWLTSTEVQVVSADTLTEEECRQFIIADNSAFGQWDYDMLANEWDDSLLLRFGVDLPWLDMSPVESEPEKKSSSSSTQEEKAAPRCKPGETWQLGDHRLYCGDTDISTCDKLIAHWEKLTGRSAEKVTTKKKK